MREYLYRTIFGDHHCSAKNLQALYDARPAYILDRSGILYVRVTPEELDSVLADTGTKSQELHQHIMKLSSRILDLQETVDKLVQRLDKLPNM